MTNSSNADSLTVIPDSEIETVTIKIHNEVEVNDDRGCEERRASGLTVWNENCQISATGETVGQNVETMSKLCCNPFVGFSLWSSKCLRSRSGGV